MKLTKRPSIKGKIYYRVVKIVIRINFEYDFIHIK